MKKMYLLPAITTTRQTRIDSAHARHGMNTAGTWIYGPHYNPDNPKKPIVGIMPPIHCQAPVQLYYTADYAVKVSLRAREATSATNLFRELAQQEKPDRQRRELVRIAEEISTYQKQHDSARQTVESLTRTIEASTTSPADRLSAWTQREQEKAIAKKALEHKEALEQRMTSTSASDRAQLVQEAILAGLDPLNATDLDGAFKRMVNAAGRAIADLASPDALRSTRTYLHPISTEEAQAEKEAHPDVVTIDPATGEEVTTPCKVPYNVKGGNSAGYYTIERREQTKARPAGWYRVHHYATIAPYVSFETFATGESTEPIAKNNGINAIETVSDREQIEALIDRANLTEREREVVLKLCDQTAKRHAEEARQQSLAESAEAIAKASRKHKSTRQQEAQAKAESAYNSALWDSAFTRAGIYAKTTRHDIKRRVIAKMTKARRAPEPMTPAEQAEQERQSWERMQGNRYRGQTHAEQALSIDLLGAVTTWASAQSYKPATRWAELTEAPQAISKDEAEAIAQARETARAEHLARHAEDIARLSYRQRLAPDKLRAWDSLTPAQQTARATADGLRAKADRLSTRASEAEHEASKAEARAEQARKSTAGRALLPAYQIQARALAEHEASKARATADKLRAEAIATEARAREAESKAPQI